MIWFRRRDRPELRQSGGCPLGEAGCGCALGALGALPMTSPWGWRVHPTLHTVRWHNGIDIPVAVGTPVVASRSGIVSRVDVAGVGRGEINGNAVLVRDAAGMTWAYLHLDRALVSPGQRVAQGQLIGRSGATGRVTGPHLHLTVYTAGGRDLDPVALFPPGSFVEA